MQRGTDPAPPWQRIGASVLSNQMVRCQRVSGTLSSCLVRLYDKMNFRGNRGGQARETGVPEAFPFSKAGGSISRRSGNGVT